MKKTNNLIMAFSLLNLSATAQSDKKELLSPLMTYFLAGFALLFVAAFVFSFAFKTISNQRKAINTPKQIVRSSLKLALVIALVLIVGIYFYLSF